MKREIKIPSEIFYDKRLGHSERILLITLYTFINPRTMIAKPSLRGLALRAGFKSTRTVKTCLLGLEKLDWVKVTSKKGSANEYKLSTQAILGGGIEEGTSTSLASTLLTIDKLAHSNTHTQEHDSKQQRPSHKTSQPYFTTGIGKENTEEVQFDENETDPSHGGSPGSLARNPWDFIGELYRRARLGSSDPSPNEDESLPGTSKPA